MAAKQILNGGIRRTIGTGAETNVWTYVWIPSSPERPAIQAQVIIDQDLKVHHLFNFDTKEWNEEFIYEIIHARDIPAILNLKISKSGRRDSYCWEFSKSDHYTVKLGYDIAVEQRRSMTALPFSEPSTTGLKKQVWKLNTSRKIKHFIWKAIAGFVAS